MAKPTKIDALKGAPYNPRSWTDRAASGLAVSLQEFGDISGITFNERTGHLVSGHFRVAQLRKLYGDDLPIKDGAIHTPDGKTFAVRFVDWDKAKEKRANVAANNSHIGGDFDSSLRGLLDEIKVDNEVMFEELNLDELMLDIKEPRPVPDEDEAPAVQAVEISRTGDLWLCGQHRVLCGDSTKPEDVARLMNGDRIDICVTDPPYGVSYADKNRSLNAISPAHRIQTPIANDHLSEDETQELWLKVFALIRDNLTDKGCYYIFGPQIQGMMMMMMMMQKAGLPYRHVIIWVKNNHVLGRCDYHYRHEPLFFGWTKTHNFYGKGQFKTSVWEVNKPQKNDLHPTMKPVALIAECLLNSSLESDLLYDPFLGSGTAVIAAESQNRRCYGMELAPAYVDVIVRRWQGVTGKQSTLDGDGRTFAEIEAERGNAD